MDIKFVKNILVQALLFKFSLKNKITSFMIFQRSLRKINVTIFSRKVSSGNKIKNIFLKTRKKKKTENGVTSKKFLNFRQLGRD